MFQVNNLTGFGGRNNRGKDGADNPSITSATQIMTGNDTPSDFVIASDAYLDNYAWKAFDLSSATQWVSVSANAWITYTFDTAIEINKQMIFVGTEDLASHSLHASNDGTNWDILYEATTAIAYSTTTHTWVSTKKYTRYRLICGAPSLVDIRDIRYIEAQQ